MPVSPDEFLWISILSGFSFLFVSGFIYVVLCPCRFPTRFFRNKQADKEKAKLSSVQGYSTNFGQCVQSPNILINGNPPGTPLPVIRGPQGHGFYTSGPWKIENLAGHDNLALQFSQPQLMMGDYFSMMGPTAPVADQDESDPTSSGMVGSSGAQPCHMMGNLIMCSNSWTSNNNNECDRYCNHSMGMANNNSLIDMDHNDHSDADMMMMFM